MTITHVPAGEGPAHQVISDLVQVKVAAADTDGAFSIVEVVVPPGGGPPPHRHETLEVFYVLAGSVTVTGDEGPTTGGPGDTIIIPSWAPHTYHNASAHPARFLAVMAPAGMETFFADLGTDAAGLSEPRPMTGPPDVEHVTRITARHGIELLGGRA